MLRLGSESEFNLVVIYLLLSRLKRFLILYMLTIVLDLLSKPTIPVLVRYYPPCFRQHMDEISSKKL